MKVHTTSKSKLVMLLTEGVGPFFKTLFNLVFQYLVKVHRRWNEAYLIVGGFFLWKYSEHVLALVDPTAVPMPVTDLMRFLYATIGTCVAHFTVSVMLWLSHPLIFRYLYGYFYADMYNENQDLKSAQIKHDLKCLRLKYSLLVWLLYLATWLVLVATY
jgi:hypothetical protein